MSDDSVRNLLVLAVSSLVLPLLLSVLPHTTELLYFAGADNLKGIAHSACDINASQSCPSSFVLNALQMALGSYSVALVTIKH